MNVCFAAYAVGTEILSAHDGDPSHNPAFIQSQKALAAIVHFNDNGGMERTGHILKNENGNILFLILLAVVLFAALAYAVTSSMRGGGKDASDENVKAQAADILQFFTALDSAVTRLAMQYNIEQISFQYPYKPFGSNVNNSSFANSNCTSNACRVFHPEGGGVEPRTFQKYTYQESDFPEYNSGYPSPGYYTFRMMRWPYAGTDLNDVILTMGLPGPLCDEINKNLNIPLHPLTPFVLGSWLSASNPAAWDGSGYYISSRPESLMNSTTFTGQQGSSSTGKRNCALFHLVITR